MTVFQEKHKGLYCTLNGHQLLVQSVLVTNAEAKVRHVRRSLGIKTKFLPCMCLFAQTGMSNV